jgi:uncharacterized membrane protein YdjX (TVP38/TMEM64 family)
MSYWEALSVILTAIGILVGIFLYVWATSEALKSDRWSWVGWVLIGLVAAAFLFGLAPACIMMSAANHGS